MSKQSLFNVKSPSHSNLMTKTLLKKLLTRSPALIEIPAGAPVEVAEAHTRYANKFDTPGPPLHVGSVHTPTRQSTHFYTNHPTEEARHQQLAKQKSTKLLPVNEDVERAMAESKHVFGQGFNWDYYKKNPELKEAKPSLVAPDCHAWHLIGPGVFFIYTLETINTIDAQQYFTHPLYAMPIISPVIEFLPIFGQPRLILPDTKKPAQIAIYVPDTIKIEFFSVYPIAHLTLFSSLLTPPINEMLSYTLDELDQEKGLEPAEKICNPEN